MKSLIAALFIVSACASHNPKVVDNKSTIEKDYKVTDASSRYRPTWVEDASFWAKEEKQDLAAWQFYSFETSAKADRELACDLAKANVKADIAAQIKTKIEKNLDSFREDGQTALSEGGFVRSYIERSLKSKISQNLVGARTEKTYWEKRSFLKDMGAPKDVVGYTCAVLTKIQKKNVELAIDRAFNELYEAKQAKKYKAQIDKAVNQALK